MDLAPFLHAHAYLQVERPPELWEADVDDAALVRVLGEMIAAALVLGTQLGDIVLRVNNVTVEHPEDEDVEGCEAPAEPLPGDYVALSVLGSQGDWRPERSWQPGVANPSPLLNADLELALRAARIPFAYTRSAGEGGSVTIFLRRATRSRAAELPG